MNIQNCVTLELTTRLDHLSWEARRMNGAIIATWCVYWNEYRRRDVGIVMGGRAMDNYARNKVGQP